jgi:hypothetical protein
MPVNSAKQFGMMEAAAHGSKLKGIGPPRKVAEEFIKKTPSNKRKRFAQILASKRA